MRPSPKGLTRKGFSHRADGRRGPQPQGGMDPREIGALLTQGVALQMKGQLWPAREFYQAVLDRQPNQPDALHLMALIALEAMQVEAAVDMLKRAVPQKPTDPALRGSYADALMLSNDAVAAERQLRRALKLSPEHSDLLCKLARCLAMLGREDEARSTFEAVLARGPDHPTALVDYADFLIQVGEPEKAEATYRRAVASDASPALALAGLAECRRYEGDPPELAAIQARLDQPGLRASEAIKLSQAAAKICNDIGKYDDAFSYYSSIKQFLAPDIRKSDPAAQFKLLRSIFTPDFFAVRAGYGDRSQKPVFIVGMPRSGTTLTEQIIASHPKAAGAGEFGVPRKIAMSLGYHGAPEDFARRVNALKSKEAATIAHDGISMLERFSDRALRITDKLPHNFEFLGLVALLFPRAKIIHCRRSALDTCVSCFLTPLKEAHAYAYDLKALGEYYREYAALMDYWRQVLPTPILDLDYEELVGDTERQSRRLIDFIGLEWDPACLDFHTNSRAVHTISRAQVRQPIYSTSVERWRRYEKHLGPLRTALGDLAS